MGSRRLAAIRTVGAMSLRALGPFLLSLGLATAAAADPTAQQVIDRLKMQLIPGEGCWFALTYKSPDPIEGPAAAHADGPSMGSGLL